MSPEHDIDDLRRQVATTPGDAHLRAQFVEALLEVDQEEAHEQARRLLESTKDDPAVLAIGLATAVATGDNLLAARFQRRLRRLIEDVEDTGRADGADELDEDEGSAPSSDRHPSTASGVPALRLLPGEPTGPSRLATARTLKDVVGLATVRRRLERVIADARDGSAPSSDGWPGGLLLYGPPACGKTFCSEAVAGELGAVFWHIDLAQAWRPDALSSVLSNALMDSDPGHVVVLLDNLDCPPALARLQPALPALDAARARGGSTVLATATYPWQVSNAILRPGRLDDVLLVLPPDEPARRTFLTGHLRDGPRIDEADIDWVARHTEGHSFADLERLVDVAVTLALASADAGAATTAPPSGTLDFDDATSIVALEERKGSLALRHVDVRQARQQVHASSAGWLTVAGHHALMNEGGGLYDDLLAYFRARQRH